MILCHSSVRARSVVHFRHLDVPFLRLSQQRLDTLELEERSFDVPARTAMRGRSSSYPLSSLSICNAVTVAGRHGLVLATYQPRSILPALAFSLDMFSKTDMSYGVNEVLLASVIGSVVFALAAAQPLVIVGVTGNSKLLLSLGAASADVVRSNHGLQLHSLRHCRAPGDQLLRLHVLDWHMGYDNALDTSNHQFMQCPSICDPILMRHFWVLCGVHLSTERHSGADHAVGSCWR